MKTKIIICILVYYYFFYKKYKIKFYVINLKKDEDRMKNIENNLLRNKINFQRIEAISLENYDLNSQNLQNILSPIKDLMNTKFTHKDKEWFYDGTIYKSFPGLDLNGHWGTKGLTLSNIKTFNTILEQNKKFWSKKIYHCILEDDAVITKDVYKQILLFINNQKGNKKYDVILLDARFNGEGGCAGVIYSNDIIPKIKEDLHPCSKFSQENEKKHIHKKGLNCNLWDWKLYSYLKTFNINFGRLPIVKTNGLISTINTKFVTQTN
jgi:hypothetical protein